MVNIQWDIWQRWVCLSVSPKRARFDKNFNNVGLNLRRVQVPCSVSHFWVSIWCYIRLVYNPGIMLWAWKRRHKTHLTGIFFLTKSCLFLYGLIIWQMFPYLYSIAESTMQWKDSNAFLPRKDHFLMVQILSHRAWAGTHKLNRELHWFGRTSKEIDKCRCIVWGTRCYWCELKYALKIQPEPRFCWKGPKKSSWSIHPIIGRVLFH